VDGVSRLVCAANAKGSEIAIMIGNAAVRGSAVTMRNGKRTAAHT